MHQNKLSWGKKIIKHKYMETLAILKTSPHESLGLFLLIKICQKEKKFAFIIRTICRSLAKSPEIDG
jgi:hypothetical protein